MLLLGERVIETRADGALRLKGVYFETDYADFLAWTDFGHPGEPVDNCFSMAALRSDDGAFLLGEMAHHTYNAGQIYFPAGNAGSQTTCSTASVDLEASARRELLEETGLLAAETNMAPRLDPGDRASAHRLHEADDASLCPPPGSRRGSKRSWRATLWPSFRACTSCAVRKTSMKRGCRFSSPIICATHSLKDRSDSRDAFREAATIDLASASWPAAQTFGSPLDAVRRSELCVTRG